MSGASEGSGDSTTEGEGSAVDAPSASRRRRTCRVPRCKNKLLSGYLLVGLMLIA